MTASSRNTIIVLTCELAHEERVARQFPEQGKWEAFAAEEIPSRIESRKT